MSDSGGRKRAPDVGGGVIRLKVRPLLLAAVAPDGRDVEHAAAELYERAALDGDVQVGHVAQHEVDELFQGGLAEVIFEALHRQELCALVRHEAVLAKGEVREF